MSSKNTPTLEQTKAIIQQCHLKLKAEGHKVPIGHLYAIEAQEHGFASWKAFKASALNQKSAEVVKVLEAEVVKLEGSDQIKALRTPLHSTLCKGLEKDRSVELALYVMKYLGRLPARWGRVDAPVSRDTFLISILQLLRNEWKITEKMEEKWFDELVLEDLPKNAEHIKIRIGAYPVRFHFDTNVALPPFSYGCRVRQIVLVDAMQRLMIKSPNHSYDDYVVEDVKTTKDGERWGLGS